MIGQTRSHRHAAIDYRQGVIVERLTRRERQIAEATVRGLTNRQIACEFGISAETVKRHLATIYGKLALPGRVALAIHVVQSRAA